MGYLEEYAGKTVLKNLIWSILPVSSKPVAIEYVPIVAAPEFEDGVPECVAEAHNIPL